MQKPLLYIFQRSFNEGVFPEKLKKAKITSIFKKSETTDLKNYRPSLVDIRPKLATKIPQTSKKHFAVYKRCNIFVITNRNQ